MFKSVRRDVKKSTRNQQTPWESHSLTEDIYFNGSPKDRVADQQNMLQQLADIRKQQQTTEQQLQQVFKQQKKARSTQKHQTVVPVEGIRNQSKTIGAIINPSVLEEQSKSNLEKSFRIQKQPLMVSTNQQLDSNAYAEANVKNTSEAYLNYLNNCSSPCAYKKQAVANYKNLQIKLDYKSYLQAKKKGSSKSYQYYLENCNIICDYQTQAQQNLKISKETEQRIKQDKQIYLRPEKIIKETGRVTPRW